MRATVEGQEVKIGDYVGFKSDVEQGGEIVKIMRSTFCPGEHILTLKAGPEGFQGGYIGGDVTTTVNTSDCWLD